MIESEIKASLEGIDREDLIARIGRLGFRAEESKHQTDVYYNGRDRDFRKTDEALRLRRTEYAGGSEKSAITYKGPKMDSVTMTREEIQTDVRDGQEADRLIRALGFEPVMTVEKTRQRYTNYELLADPKLDRTWTPVTKHAMAVCIDDVSGLGPFIEIEILLKDDSGLGAARANLHQMLDVLMVPQENATTKSYLDQLMEKNEE
ncbi:MAG: class IV adenylate cyclase [Anaerovoracaceae bacterium]|jgi:adenylate cyclase class 2